ncbi:MAG: FAD-dependent oxidoreductase [Planctomycetota bacterium]
MPPHGPVELDVVILGGGAAGLWILDDLGRAGYEVILLEANSLGHGQTIASQGIIHGGMKYSLGGLVGDSGRAIREMPARWRRCLDGDADPRLVHTRVRADHCHLWQTASLRSRLAMVGARAGLRVRPVMLEPEERPEILASCPGTVARLDEQVIDPASFLRDLAAPHERRLLQIDAVSGLHLDHDGAGAVRAVTIRNPDGDESITLAPRLLILAAGTGNEALCNDLDLDASMQRRPLHMVMARGDLPVVNGHCVDGGSTRVTITSAEDRTGRTVWQIGGQIAETAVDRDARSLAAHARDELLAVLPAVSLAGVEWATYRADRAEPRSPTGRRPASAHARRDGSVIVTWPTKLALVPRLADLVRQLVREAPRGASIDPQLLRAWPRPEIARPPWETETTWFSDL